MNVLFVCTGNTCRSPMAAALFNKIAVEKDLDVRIESAGLFANDGEPASENAVAAMKDYGVDLSEHVSEQELLGAQAYLGKITEEEALHRRKELFGGDY